ncbi:hypothetical protein L6E12_07545 [Actinokineospora sp. PR83]|uniref:hypothetical protein n=1 Tax=Actinokineospora sp. PR83 TaxID=2884908 RepID=UPI001F365C6C|nr:hypothetical protein [Actinokineospora sp. PR83]MCG8915637.1 hypothetical protein [Actinokineospora sp. PR83]
MGDRRLPGVGIVLALVLDALALTVLGADAARQPDNRAHVDHAETAQAQARAVAIAEALFSYSGADMPAQRAEAADLITGDLVTQYAELLGQAEKTVREQQVTSKVTHSGVRLLDPGKAEVLLFLTQSSARPGEAPNSGGTQFVLTLVRGGSGWQQAKGSAIDLLGAR